MSKLFKILISGVLSISLIACSNVDNAKDKEVNIDIVNNNIEEINELKKEISMLKQEIVDLNEHLEENHVRLCQVEAITYNLSEVDSKHAYINSIKQENDTIEIHVDYFEWVTGEDAGDSPNGFKIVNDIEENKKLSFSSDIQIYVIDGASPMYIPVEDFIKKVNEQSYKIPCIIYTVKGKIVLIQEQYVP